MTPEDARGLIARYRVSWFARIDHIDADKVVRGADVPATTGLGLVQTMLENVDDSHTAKAGTEDRLANAVRDGLLRQDLGIDDEVLHSLPKELRGPFASAARTVVGDVARARSELTHWRGYVRWAQEQASLPTPPAPRAPMPARALDAKERQAGERLDEDLVRDDIGADDGDDFAADAAAADAATNPADAG